MKRIPYILISFILALFTLSCSQYDNEPNNPGNGNNNTTGEGEQEEKLIPTGHFEVNFKADPTTRAAITGSDGRIRDLRYIVFKSTGEFVKEKRIVTPASGTQTWPIAHFRDTLPKGSYRAVFVGNAEKTLFPYSTQSNPTNYNDVLSGYQSGYSSARIIMPNTEFTSTTEYYLSNVTFSDSSNNPYIILQRIISSTTLHRNLIDAQVGLNKLINNINVNAALKAGLRIQVGNTLTALIRAKLDLGDLGNAAYNVVGGLDGVVNALAATLLDPVTDALYTQLVQKLTTQLGIELAATGGGSGSTDALTILASVLNPWTISNATHAVVSINNFIKSVDFDLNVKENFTGIQKFKYKFTSGSNGYADKSIVIKNFGGLLDIRKVNVASNGIIAGIIIDNGVDGPYLLSGKFFDINDQMSLTTQANEKYTRNYNTLDVKLQTYALLSDQAHTVALSVQLSAVPGIDNLVKAIPLLAPIVSLPLINTLILAPLKTILVNANVNLPSLSLANLAITGGWQDSSDD